MLAKAVADLNKAVFFCCSAASLISKFRGESEKIVKCLFEAARLCAPAIIFLDEIGNFYVLLSIVYLILGMEMLLCLQGQQRESMRLHDVSKRSFSHKWTE